MALNVPATVGVIVTSSFPSSSICSGLDESPCGRSSLTSLIVTGSPGGSRIITAVLQVLLNTIEHRMTIAESVQAPRIHHQWLPDETMIEPGVSAAMARALEARGHNVKVWAPFTSAPSIMVMPEGLVGAADTRTRGALAVGH